MTELLDTATSWRSLLLAVVAFGFAPGFCLRLLVLIYPRSDPRRTELIAELYVVPRIQRPLWVAEQLETALFEGLPHRLSAVLRRAAHQRRANNDLTIRTGRRRWSIAGLVALTLAVIGGSIVGALEYLNSRFPTTAEQTLLGDLPLALIATNSCTRNSDAEQDTANVHASVICVSNGDVNRVVFTRFNSPQALDKHYQATLAATGVGESLGDCHTAERAESVYTSDSGRTSGRVLCYQRRGSAFVEWTDEESRTLGVATRTAPDYEKLRSWWRAVVGVEIN